MKPIHKFNNGRGATLCHLCRTIITVGKPTNDLYCDRCLTERTHTEKEFNKLKENLKKHTDINGTNHYLSDWSEIENSEWNLKRIGAIKANWDFEEYYKQMNLQSKHE